VAGKTAFNWELALNFLNYLAKKGIINRSVYDNYHSGICSMPSGNEREKMAIGKLIARYHKEYLVWRTKRRLLGEESR